MSNSADNLEIEVKFHLDKPEQMRQRLIKLGADQGAEVFETNVRFDDDSNNLQRQDQLLRLRKDTGCRLTYKTRPADADREVKVYRELEVEVSDYHTMVGILNGIGFQAVQIYEKWRETFGFLGTEICIDRMPYGIFIEIEGPKSRIKKVARQLELPWRKRILTNYLAIFELLRKAHPLPFNDVTFDHFSQHAVDIERYLPELEAGSE